ncbi:hypothetical protein BH23THE1_BH23THE1_22240 [soil metagenome]
MMSSVSNERLESIMSVLVLKIAVRWSYFEHACYRRKPDHCNFNQGTRIIILDYL